MRRAKSPSMRHERPGSAGPGRVRWGYGEGAEPPLCPGAGSSGLCAAGGVSGAAVVERP